MKALKSSHREHKRYILISGKDANRENFEEAVLKFLGILGYAEACPEFIKLENPKSGKMVVSINREFLNKIKSAIFLSGKNIAVEKVSGALNKL